MDFFLSWICFFKKFSSIFSFGLVCYLETFIGVVKTTITFFDFTSFFPPSCHEDHLESSFCLATWISKSRALVESCSKVNDVFS